MAIASAELEEKLRGIFKEAGVDLEKSKSGFLIKALVTVAEYVRDNGVVTLEPHLGPDDVTHRLGTIK